MEKTVITLTVENPEPGHRYVVQVEPLELEIVDESSTASTVKSEEAKFVELNQERVEKRSARLGSDEKRSARCKPAQCQCGRFVKQGVKMCTKCVEKALVAHPAWQAWHPCESKQ